MMMFNKVFFWFYGLLVFLVYNISEFEGFLDVFKFMVKSNNLGVF